MASTPSKYDPKAPVFQVRDCIKQDPSDSPKDISIVWKGPRRCKYCDKIEIKRENMKNHSLNHFKEKLNSIIPPESLVAPFPCPFFPECHDPKDSSKPKCHRDKVTFQRHFAFQHRKIYEICSYEDLMGEEIDEDSEGQPTTSTPRASVKTESNASSSKRPISTSKTCSTKKVKHKIKEEVEVTVDPIALEFEEDEPSAKESDANEET